MSTSDWEREKEEDENLEPLGKKDEIPPDWEPSPETLRAIWGDTDVARWEETRLDTAAQRLSQIEWLKPEAWNQLDEYQRRVALDLTGRELADIYECPNPPLLAGPLAEDMDPNLLGAYDDEEYYIAENLGAEIDYGRLLGDDPAAALRTYAHEFRHTYQHYQASLYESGQLFISRQVHDVDKAREWSVNLQDYKAADDDYDTYYNQPVERDARDFAEKLVRRIYG